MMTARTLAWVFAIFSLILGVFLATMLKGTSVKELHTLNSPLLLQPMVAGEPASLLPKGTTLYRDMSSPEAPTRYVAYVNVEGTQLDLVLLTDGKSKPPLIASVPDKVTFKQTFGTGHVAKLQSGKITAEEIRALLREYAK